MSGSGGMPRVEEVRQSVVTEEVRQSVVPGPWPGARPRVFPNSLIRCTLEIRTSRRTSDSRTPGPSGE